MRGKEKTKRVDGSKEGKWEGERERFYDSVC
jgi:hypothetical protein